MKSVFWKSAVAAVALIAAMTANSRAEARGIAQQTDAGQAYAHFLPPFETLALPSEQGVLDNFMTKARPPGAKPEVVLAAADEALAQLPAPTPLRGFIQLMRSRALIALHRELDAADAAQESAQLLPGYSAPLITAFTVNAYLSRTAEATEYLMRAIDVDPTTARTIDDYEINNLMRRLHGFHDEARARAVSDRLLQIGWIGNHLDSRSHLAAEAIKLHLANGDAAGARALVPKLLAPSDSRDLLMMKAYSDIWPDIEAWAGPRLERQWPIYLNEARERWRGGRTAIAAHDYLSALKSAGDDEAAARDILPLLEPPRKEDEEQIFIVPPLADSLARLGRWGEAEALFQRAQQVWPLGSQANALNISANQSVLLLNAGRAKDGLERMEASLADARRWGPEVSETALAAMQHKRACILHELGRDSEAAVSVAQALAFERGSSAAMLHLCMGDPAAAKKTLLDALEDETTREDVVRFMQPPDDSPDPSDYGRKQRAAADALRSDPEVLKAVARYGRVLPWRLNAAATNQEPASTEVVHVD